MARLHEYYKQTVVPELQNNLGVSNILEVPRIQKITLNMGLGGAAKDKKLLEYAMHDMELIAGQKPLVTKARKSEAGFKIRTGWPIGCKVTLRRQKMYEFLDKLITVTIPRIKDFRGLSDKSFDGNGNYSFGIKEQIAFPEIDYDKIDQVRGLDITISTTAKTNEEARALLSAFNFPLKS
jgi:large subunit ribosomal protein L5